MALSELDAVQEQLTRREEMSRTLESERNTLQEQLTFLSSRAAARHGELESQVVRLAGTGQLGAGEITGISKRLRLDLDMCYP